MSRVPSRPDNALSADEAGDLWDTWSNLNHESYLRSEAYRRALVAAGLPIPEPLPPDTVFHG